MHKYVRGRRVLDVFSYIGAWGIQAAVAGASEVCCVDASPLAQASLQHNIAVNNLGDRVQLEAGDAFEVLDAMQTAGRHFDVVIRPGCSSWSRRASAEGARPWHPRRGMIASSR